MRNYRVGFAANLAALFSIASLSAQQPEETAREEFDRDRSGLETQNRLQNNRYIYIPFEQVLAAPEDLKLNLEYARQQIAAGDLKEGSAALERILLINPQLHDVRVLYGFVLFRLGLYDRARFELENALASAELPLTLRIEAEAYLKRIRRVQQSTRGSLSFSFGTEYNHNRNQSPSSGKILFLDIPLNATPRNSDFAYIASVKGEITHDLGFQAGHTIQSQLSYYRSDKIEVDNLDLDVINFVAGGTFNLGALSITPAFRAGYYWLAGSDYLQSIGGELDVLMRFSPAFRGYVRLRGEHEDFDSVPDAQAATFRTGRRLSARGGFIWNPNATMAFNIEGLLMDKQGKQPFEAYDRYGGQLQHSWLLGRGAFTLSSFTIENSSYDGVDAFTSPSTIRNDWLYRGRFSVGAPISFFVPTMNLPSHVEDINLVAQYEYENVDSNIPNYDYNTHKVSLMLSKRIPF